MGNQDGLAGVTERNAELGITFHYYWQPSMTNSISRRSASCFTSSMMGKAPVPVPTTSRRHFQGMSSSIESGVCPKGGAELFRWLLIPLADVAAIDHDVVLVGRSINADRPKGKCLEAQTRFPRSFPATASLAHKSSAIQIAKISALMEWKQIIQPIFGQPIPIPLGKVLKMNYDAAVMGSGSGRRDFFTFWELSAA
jgi:hypothetical protein